MIDFIRNSKNAAFLGMGVLVLLMLVGLATSTIWFDYFAGNYAQLIILNSVGIVTLCLWIGVYLKQLIKERRAKLPGTQLAIRFLRIFATLLLSSMAIVYFFSFLSISRGIDSWFDLQVGDAVKEANHLRVLFFDSIESRLLSEFHSTIEGINEAISQETDQEHARRQIFQLIFKASQSEDFQEITYFDDPTNPTGAVISSSMDTESLLPKRPSASLLEKLISDSSSVTQLESLTTEDATDNGTDEVLVTNVNIPAWEILFGADGETQLQMLIPVEVVGQGNRHFLQVLANLPLASQRLLESISQINEKYNRLLFLRNPLKLSFILTLTFVTLIAILLAIWAAINLTRRLVTPISMLSEGTQAVARGEYGHLIAVPARDELGVLVESFNDMTQKIKTSQEQLRKSQINTERQSYYLEIVLKHLSSGVLFIDDKGYITNVNLAAENILQLNEKSICSTHLDQLTRQQPELAPLLGLISEATKQPQADWSETVSLETSRGQQVLSFSVTQLPEIDSVSGSYVVVMEDITDLVQAQRGVAWREVARRMAHEILNPLQPIQSGVDRIRLKTERQLSAEESTSLNLAYEAIYRQLNAMQRIVNEFRDYDKPVILKFSNVNLNKLILDVANLHRQSDWPCEISLELDPQLKEFSADSDKLVQVFNNLLINAKDAIGDSDNAIVKIRTQQSDNGIIQVLIIDNGPGFARDVLDRLFEPYATTKSKGMGLGLGIVKKIVEAHNGTIDVANGADRGTNITINFYSQSQLVAESTARNGNNNTLSIEAKI